MSVIEGYQIQGIMAKGGMATIYIAMQKSLKRQIALKILDPNLDATLLEHFLDESRIIASLKHPNIIPVYDVGRVGIHFYHSMEYLEGGDLESRIAKGIDTRTTLEIILELADALHLVHSKGIIHGDIKPANVVFRSDECPVLIDFGISKRTKVSHNKEKQTKLILASPSYASPEIMQGLEFDQKVDIYSLGIMLYEMLTGKKPYTGKTQTEIVANSIQQSIPLLPDNLKAMQPLLDRMLAKDPLERIGDAQMISRYIKNYLRDQPNQIKIYDINNDENGSVNNDQVVVEYVSDKKDVSISDSRTLLPILIVLLSADVAFAIWYFIL